MALSLDDLKKFNRPAVARRLQHVEQPQRDKPMQMPWANHIGTPLPGDTAQPKTDPVTTATDQQAVPSNAEPAVKPPRPAAKQPVTTGNKPPLMAAQPVTNTSPTRLPRKPLPTSQQQLQILQTLAQQQAQEQLDHTPRLKRATLAEMLNTSANGVHVQITRLVAAGYLEVIDARDGRGEAGTVYRVRQSVLRDLKQHFKRQKAEPT